ncbi:hypothetical protein ACFOJE_11285 [Azotobacter bryophylli]|uniref:Lipoprotein n=1 Tax=Azotobacter bryophylli TaxID=1986537 RepID=A0ABV7ATF2_9GAMM
MLLQTLWSPFVLYPAQLLNSLALFFAFAGSWLLLATRIREQRMLARVVREGRMEAGEECLADEPTLKINRFFYCFGAGSLSLALLLSWSSTQL